MRTVLRTSTPRARHGRAARTRDPVFGHTSVSASALHGADAETRQADTWVAARNARRLIRITAVRMEGGTEHLHITEVLWEGPSSSGHTSTGALIDWLKASGANRAVVGGDGERVAVLVVE